LFQVFPETESSVLSEVMGVDGELRALLEQQAQLEAQLEAKAGEDDDIADRLAQVGGGGWL
jgi:hypothetical protein